MLRKRTPHTDDVPDHRLPAGGTTWLVRVAVALLVGCWACLGIGPGLSSALAACRPTFTLVFVPMAWQGTLGTFDQEVDTAMTQFVTISKIDAYAEVKVTKLHQIMPADLTDWSLDMRVVAFGARHAPGDRYIGLTDGDLAPGGNTSVAGWTTMFGQGVVAETSDLVDVSHELGHTFGLCDEYNILSWRGSNGRGPCPNPYPSQCPRDPRSLCDGDPLPGGGYCAMGPAGLPGPRGFDTACKAGLETQFARLFGDACAPPPATPTAPPTPPPAPPPATPTPTPIPTPAPPPSLGRLAFEADLHGHSELYTADSDGTGMVRLTYSAGNAYQPSWSPDGDQLVFAASDESHMQLYTINADGTRRRRLQLSAADDELPAWSPDGQWIAFASNRSGRFQLYRVHPDGSGLSQVTNGGGNSYAPSWSPDSTRLAYYGDGDGTFQIYTIGADGSGLARLTTTPADDIQPSWSPDGTLIAFASDRQSALRLWVMDADGGNQHALTSTPTYSWRPAWLADPHWLAFQAGSNGKLSLYLVNAATGERRRVTPSGFIGSSPAPLWSKP